MSRSNLLTVSRMRTWRNCKREHSLKYVSGWRPVKVEEPLAVGTLIHLGLEAWWTSRGSKSEMMSMVYGEAENPYQQALVDSLLDAYHFRWIGELNNWEILSVESQFDAPLINPETMGTSRTWRLGGKLDVIAKNVTTGEVTIIEHKTTSENVEHGSDYWTKLAMDAQVSHYYFGAESQGVEPTTCVYDVLRKPQIRFKKESNPDTRYKKDGGLKKGYREEDESPEDFRVRLDEVIAEGEFFVRHEVPRTEDDLMTYLGDVWDEARIMAESERKGRDPRNPEACHRLGRKTCTFWDHCAYGAVLEESPDRWVQKDNVHPELKQENKEVADELTL